MSFCVEERGLRATANQKLSPFTGKVAWRSHDERGITRSGRVPRGVPPQSVHYRSQTAPPQAVEPLTPSVSLRSTAPSKREPFYVAWLSYSNGFTHSASLASHRHKQANCLRFLCDARCDDKFCVSLVLRRRNSSSKLRRRKKLDI